MTKRNKIKEMKLAKAKIAKLDEIRSSIYQGAVEELGLIDDSLTFDYFYNNGGKPEDVLNPVKTVGQTLVPRSPEIMQPLYTPCTRISRPAKVRLPNGKKAKAECAECFDEEGSLGCVRPAHQRHPDDIALDALVKRSRRVSER